MLGFLLAVLLTMASATPSSTTTRPPTQSGRLSFSQLEQLWKQNGGNPRWAATMAAVALAESGGKYGPNEINNNQSTCDYSVGLWQINYFKGYCPTTGRNEDLATGRTQQYGSAQNLASDPNANARAAIDLLGDGSGITNWAGDPAGSASIAYGGPLTQAQAKSVAGGAFVGQTSPLPAGALTANPSQATDTGTTCGDAKGIKTPGLFGTSAGSVTILNGCQLKAIKGALFIIAGGSIMLIGVAFLIGKSAKLPSPLAAAGGFLAGRETSERQSVNQPLRTVAPSKAELDFETAREQGRENARQAGPFEEG